MSREPVSQRGLLAKTACVLLVTFDEVTKNSDRSFPISRFKKAQLSAASRQLCQKLFCRRRRHTATAIVRSARVCSSSSVESRIGPLRSTTARGRCCSDRKGGTAHPTKGGGASAYALFRKNVACLLLFARTSAVRPTVSAL